MKSLLIIFLFVFCLCFEDEKLSSWKKYTVTKEDQTLKSVMAVTYTNYTENSKNIDMKIDDLLLLTVHNQLVNGMNFKITFVNRKSDFPSIHEYIVNRPIPKNGEDLVYSILERNEYDESKGLIKFDDPKFTEVENQLYKFLKKKSINLLYISYVYPVENDETKFYIINADTEDGENLFVVGYDRAAKKYDFCVKIK